MRAETLAVAAERPERLPLRVTRLCGVVLFLEGYDIAAVGYAIPSLVDAWRTQVLTAGNIGLLLGSLGVGLLGDQLGRKPVLLSCVAAFGVFSLLSAFVGSLLQMPSLRFLTGLGLGGGIPLAIALASDFAPPMGHGRLVILVGVSNAGRLSLWLAPGCGSPASENLDKTRRRPGSLDHLFGSGEQRGRHGNAQRFRGLDVDHRVGPLRQLYRQLDALAPCRIL
jgi:MFS family permease